MDGREVVLTLDDGSKVRVEVEVEKEAEHARDLIGEDVKAKIEPGEDKPKLVEIEKSPDGSVASVPGLKVAPEDFHFSGAIEAMGANVWIIGGKAFQVNAATGMDQGLASGVQAEVEFILLSDGSMLATNIETEAPDDIALIGGQSVAEVAEDFSLTGVIGSLSANQLVLGGKTFKVDANTMLDQGLAAWVLARVEFVMQADSSMLALEVETDAPDSVLPGAVREAGEDFTASGPIQFLDAGSVTIDGRRFAINSNTELDSGLAAGVLAKVEFIIQPDGTMVAKEVETTTIDEGVNLYFAGPIQSMGATSWVIGGKTFAVTAGTLLDQGLGLGVNANVEFVANPDGSLVAVHIENSGFEFTGLVQAIALGSYSIGGRTFRTDANTLLDRGLKVRKLAQVDFIIQADGSLLALKIKTAKTRVQAFTFKGVVQSMSATAITVTGETFQIGPTTISGAGVAVGAQVNVAFDIQPGNILSALSVQNAAAASKKK